MAFSAAGHVGWLLVVTVYNHLQSKTQSFDNLCYCISGWIQDSNVFARWGCCPRQFDGLHAKLNLVF
jgi:hypothetical protein